MMKKALITAALLSLFIVSAALAQNDTPCEFAGVPFVSGQLTSPQSYTISWKPVQGATTYVIDENNAAFNIEGNFTRQFVTRETSITITHESINDVTYLYNIRAFGNRVDCNIRGVRVKTFGDLVLRRAVRRGIIPIVGSARGANGAEFRTYLRLEGPGLKGKIIFHPAGRVASDDDPSMPYDTSMKNEWDDVVSAMGQTGIGSLSIVPDESATPLLPRATVRLYNVASNGIYGANVEMYPAVGFLDVHTPFQRIDVPADGSFRANVGARAILAGTAHAILAGADGLLKGTADRTIEAGEVLFGSPEAIYGLDVEPGDTLVVTFTRAIVPFFTLTDNRTNDPFVYVQGAERTDVVDQYTK